MDKRLFLTSSLALAAAGSLTTANAQRDAAPMVKLVFLLHRKPGMTAEEFHRYWRDVHGPIGAAMPGVRRYVQNHASSALDGSPAPCDGFAEIWFDDTASMTQALTSPEGLAAQADAANFMDVSRVPTFVVEETAIV